MLATQCLLQRRPRTYEVRVDGRLAPGVSAKDVILNLLSRIGFAGGTGASVSAFWFHIAPMVNPV